jgi:hypothetical protein
VRGAANVIQHDIVPETASDKPPCIPIDKLSVFAYHRGAAVEYHGIVSHERARRTWGIVDTRGIMQGARAGTACASDVHIGFGASGVIT